MLKFKCPSCGRSLAGIEPMYVETQIVKRTCSNNKCKEVWQLKISCIAANSNARYDKAEFTFLGRKITPRLS